MKVLGIVFVLATCAAEGFAYPHVDVIGSETLSTVPPRYKTTFTVQLVGYNPPAAWYGVELTSSGLGAPVTFYGTECPGYPWRCSYDAGMAGYYVDGGGLQGLLTFSVTTDQAVPCVTIRIPDMLLSKTPHTENDYVIHGCLAVDMPTPVAPLSWGSVKAIYR